MGKKDTAVVIGVCFIFFVCYSVLSVVRHAHFGSYGFDLGITDQIMWLYSRFQSPITTIQAYPFTSILTDHVELIYIILAPFYWIYQSPVTLLISQAIALAFSGIPIYLLARKRNIRPAVCTALVISYLLFFGLQNAVWFDVHSLSFGAAFLAWFVYFLDTKNTLWALITLMLAVICKEDVAYLTGFVGSVYYLKRRDYLSLATCVISFAWLAVVFGIYFPFFTRDGYRYGDMNHVLSSMHISALYDSVDKRATLLYSLSWFGWLGLLSPLFLVPAITDVAHYFIFAPNLTAAQGLFMHYRVTLGVLLVLPTIITISRWKKLNTKYTAVYLVLWAMILQYVLHLPLSYLSKQWFWTKPKSVADIQIVLKQLPKDASVVSQNNITPHISHRRQIFTLYPSTKEFKVNSPCEEKICDWFRWSGTPEYLVVDTSLDWDERSFLVNRDRFKKGLTNLTKNGNIIAVTQSHESTIYRIVNQPN